MLEGIGNQQEVSNMEIYNKLSKLYSRRFKNIYKEIFVLANVKFKLDYFLGFMMFSSLGLFLFLSLFFARLFGYNVLFFLPLSLLFVHIIFYMLLVLQADARARIVEDILPDALQLMSANMRAGMTTDKALILAVKPEFGPLADELNIVGKEVVMGEDIGIALISMSNRIKSKKLIDTTQLIDAGLKSGGELAQLLSQTAQNLRNQKFVEEKIRASVFMYFIFIFSAIALGSPLLFSLSSFLAEVLTSNLGNLDIPASASANLPITLSGISVSMSFVMTFVIVSLITNSILGSLVLGLIRKGRERDGIKFIPVLIVLTLLIFFSVRLIIKSAFGSLFF